MKNNNMKSKIYKTVMLLVMLLAAIGLIAQPIVGYSEMFTYNTKYKISGTVTNAFNGLPVEGATVRSLLYSSLPSGTDGSFGIFVPPGYGYTVYATAQNFTTKYVYNVHVLQSNPVTTVNFQLDGQENFMDYRFRELSQAPNPELLEIPKGGTGYAWFVVEGEVSPGIWLPVPNAHIVVIDGQGNPVLDKNGQAIRSNHILYSFLINSYHIESYGHFCVPVRTAIIQDGFVGQQEQFTLVSVNGQSVSLGNQATFTAKVVPYEIAKSWGFRVYAKGGVGAGSITGIARGNGFAGGGMGSGIKVKFDNPDNTTDWSAFQVTRKFDLFGGVSASVGPPDLLAVDAGISSGITASFPYQGEYDFDMDNIAGLEAALAFYLFYEPAVLFGGSALPGGQIGVAFLSWLVQALIANQGQNGLGIARISDASGLDIKGHIDAEVGVGFDLAKSLKLGMNTSLGAHAHFGTFIQHENNTNRKNSTFYLGGGYDASYAIGPKFIGQNNTKAKFMYPFRLNQTIIPTSLDVEFSFTKVKQNSVWQKTDLEASLESNSSLLNIYNLPGQRQKYAATLTIESQDVYNWLNNVAEIPNELSNIGITAVNVAIDNNSFRNDMEKFLEKIYEEQNNDAPVLLDYSLKAEDKNEYEFDLTVQFPLPVFPAIDIVIGGGLEANNITEYDLVEGFWVKGYPYFRTELPTPVNPDLSFGDVMDELWQNVINKEIWVELKNVIIAQISNSKFIKWLFSESDTQLVLLNERGSTLEIRQNSIPQSIDSLFCRQWDWNQEPTRALTDSEQVTQYKRYAKALRSIREEAVGMQYGIGGFYRFEPTGGIFGDSTKLSITYTGVEIEGIDENSLGMYWEDSLGAWHHIPSIIEPDLNRVSAWIEHFATYTLAPRMPHGNYGLQTQPDSIPSNGNAVALIFSPVLLNNDSTQIADSTLFTVEISRGTILTEDIAPNIPGVQVAVQNGIISFEVASDSVASSIYLSARSVTGYAKCDGILRLYDTIAPAAPHNLNVIPGNSSALLSWEQVNDVDLVGYKIYYDTDTIAPLNGIHTVIGLPSPIVLGIGTNQNIIGLFNDSTYYFAVSAFDISGNESALSVFVAATPRDIPQTLSLTGITVTSDADTCFSATQYIIASDFIVESGAIALLIAGENIKLLPTTTVHDGAWMHAYIDTTYNYCQQPETMISNFYEIENVVKEWTVLNMPGDKPFFRIFPNPTKALFTLELMDSEELSIISVEIYNMLGTKILSTDLPPQPQYDFNLSGNQQGIYLIRVIKGSEVGVIRLIKQ